MSAKIYWCLQFQKKKWYIFYQRNILSHIYIITFQVIQNNFFTTGVFPGVILNLFQTGYSGVVKDSGRFLPAKISYAIMELNLQDYLFEFSLGSGTSNIIKYDSFRPYFINDRILFSIFINLWITLWYSTVLNILNVVSKH